MTKRFKNPWWVELPGVACVVAVVTRAMLSPALPERVPVHFGVDGTPDRWGPAWELWIAAIVPILFMVALTWVIDELWARQETKKAFNWIAAMVAAMTGAFTGISVTTWGIAFERTPVLRLPWGLVLGLASATCAVRVVLELVRPFRSDRAPAPAEDTSALKSLVEEKLRTGAPWVHWEVQDPAWMNALMALATGGLVVAAVVSWSQSPVVSIAALAFATVALACHGGLRVVVTRDHVKVKIGVFGISVLSKRIDEISSAAPMEFSPLKDFGGWGPGRYSFGLKMWGFFMRGTRGVKIETTAGKKYLVGSDHPDRAATVIEALIAARK
jgi:hypothetical protein